MFSNYMLQLEIKYPWSLKYCFYTKLQYWALMRDLALYFLLNSLNVILKDSIEQRTKQESLREGAVATQCKLKVQPYVLNIF